MNHSIFIFACFSFVVLLRKGRSIVFIIAVLMSSFFLENDGDDVECEVGRGFALLLPLFVFPFAPLAGLETGGSLLFRFPTLGFFLSCPTNVCPVKAKAGAPDGLGIGIVSLLACSIRRVDWSSCTGCCRCYISASRLRSSCILGVALSGSRWICWYTC